MLFISNVYYLKISSVRPRCIPTRRLSFGWSELCCHEVIILITIFNSKMGQNVLLVFMIGPLPWYVKKDKSSCKSKICKLNQSYRSLSEDLLLDVFTITMELYFFVYLPYSWQKTLLWFLWNEKFHEICSILHPYLGWRRDISIKWVGCSISSLHVSFWCLYTDRSVAPFSVWT